MASQLIKCHALDCYMWGEGGGEVASPTCGEWGERHGMQW